MNNVFFKLINSFFLAKKFIAGLVALSLLLISSNLHAQYVHTQGTKILDPSGTEIKLRGVNLGNWLLWEGYLMMGDFNYRTHTQFLNSLAGAFGGDINRAREFEHQWRLNYVTDKAIGDLQSLGFNSVRVPFHYNMFWQNNQLSNHGFQYLDRLIQFCKPRGIYILLDMHAAPGYQNPGDHSDNIDSNSSQPRNSVKFWDGNNINIARQVWRHVAARYANEPIIWGYDLINEPVLQPDREMELMPSLIQLRNAIREVDNNHIIVAEGGWWGSDFSVLDWTNAQTRNATGVTAKWDNNLVYETHHYVFGNANAINDLNGRVALTNRLNIPLILGEYGEDNNNILRTMTDWSITNIAGYFPWSFKKMSHDKTLWTITPNAIYSAVKNYISNGGTPPANAYSGMIGFAQNNIANGSAGIQWHQDFYDAIKTPQTCASAAYQSLNSRIEAESFCGMQGIQTENTSDAGGGLNVGWVDVGDWLEYNINVPSAGNYTLTYRVASTGNTGQLQFMAPTGTLAATSIPSTGGWQNWNNVSTTVSLSAGQQKIRLYASGGAFNFNWFQLTPASPTGSSSSQSSSSSSAFTRLVEAESYSSMSGVQLETTQDPQGGNQNVGWIDAGDWMAYSNINFPSSGTYRVEYRVASVSGAQLSLDLNFGNIQLGTLNIPATGGWQTWTTISHTVSVTAGTYSVGVFAPQGGWNINWLRISKL